MLSGFFHVAGRELGLGEIVDRRFRGRGRRVGRSGLGHFLGAARDWSAFWGEHHGVCGTDGAASVMEGHLRAGTVDRNLQRKAWATRHG